MPSDKQPSMTDEERAARTDAAITEILQDIEDMYPDDETDPRDHPAQNNDDSFIAEAEDEGYSEMQHPWIDPEPLLDAEAEEVDQIAHDQASYPRTPSAQLRQEW